MKAGTVVKQGISRCSGCLVIVRWSRGRGRQDLGEGRFVVLGHKQKIGHVWEVRTGEGEVVVQTRERGGSRSLPESPMDADSSGGAAWSGSGSLAALELGKRGGKRRGDGGA
jgi:hypothetical protein